MANGAFLSMHTRNRTMHLSRAYSGYQENAACKQLYLLTRGFFDKGCSQTKVSFSIYEIFMSYSAKVPVLPSDTIELFIRNSTALLVLLRISHRQGFCVAGVNVLCPLYAGAFTAIGRSEQLNGKTNNFANRIYKYGCAHSTNHRLHHSVWWRYTRPSTHRVHCGQRRWYCWGYCVDWPEQSSHKRKCAEPRNHLRCGTSYMRDVINVIC